MTREDITAMIERQIEAHKSLMNDIGYVFDEDIAKEFARAVAKNVATPLFTELQEALEMVETVRELRKLDTAKIEELQARLVAFHETVRYLKATIAEEGKHAAVLLGKEPL